MKLSDSNYFFEERLKKAKELLVFSLIKLTIVVKNSKEYLDNQTEMLALEHQKVVVFVKEDHLIESGLFSSLLKD